MHEVFVSWVVSRKHVCNQPKQLPGPDEHVIWNVIQHSNSTKPNSLRQNLLSRMLRTLTRFYLPEWSSPHCLQFQAWKKETEWGEDIIRMAYDKHMYGSLKCISLSKFASSKTPRRELPIQVMVIFLVLQLSLIFPTMPTNPPIHFWKIPVEPLHFLWKETRLRKIRHQNDRPRMKPLWLQLYFAFRTLTHLNWTSQTPYSGSFQASRQVTFPCFPVSSQLLEPFSSVNGNTVTIRQLDEQKWLQECCVLQILIRTNSTPKIP